MKPRKTIMTIPDKIIKQTELLQKASCKVLYLAGYIFEKCIEDPERVFTVSNEQLSKKFKLTERCISETIGALVKSEALEVTKLKPRTLKITKSTISAIIEDHKKRSALLEKLGKKVEVQFYQDDSDRSTVLPNDENGRSTVLPTDNLPGTTVLPNTSDRSTVLPDDRSTVLSDAQNPLKNSELDGEISKNASKEKNEVSHKENISTISNISNSEELNNNIINTPTAHTYAHTHEGEIFITIKSVLRITLDELSIRGFTENEKKAFLSARNRQDYASHQLLQLDAREWAKTHRKDNPRPKREFVPPTEQEIRDHFIEKTGQHGRIATDFAKAFIKQYEPYGWKYGKHKDKPLTKWRQAIASSWDLDKFIREHNGKSTSNHSAGSGSTKSAVVVDLGAAIARRGAVRSESERSVDCSAFTLVDESLQSSGN